MTKTTRSIRDIDILTAEVMAIREMVIHARKNNYSKIIIESNSFTMIQAINRSTTPRT